MWLQSGETLCGAVRPKVRGPQVCAVVSGGATEGPPGHKFRGVVTEGPTAYRRSIMSAAAEERQAKLRKLDHLRRKAPALSQSALHGLLRDIQDEGEFPEFIQRKHMREATSKQFCSKTRLMARCGVGTFTVENKDGTSQNIVFARPFAILSRMFEECCSFRDLVKRSHEAKPSSHEVVDFLHRRVDSWQWLGGRIIHRKVQAIYWSFAEFGSDTLCKENAWMCMLVHRSKLNRQVVGGMGKVVGMALREVFTGASNLLDTGVFLPIHK